MMRVIFITVGALVFFIALMTVSMMWSGEFGEIRTPRRYFTENFNVRVSADAKLVHDERGMETILVWQCSPQEIADIISNPPAGYRSTIWQPWPENRFFGPFNSNNRDWENCIFLEATHKVLIVDEKNFRLIGVVLSSGR